jgi:hypothetical protein
VPSLCVRHVTNNVANNTPLAWALFTQGDTACPASYNAVDNLWYSVALAPFNQGPNNTWDAATIYNVTGEPWPADAAAIIAHAGARQQG